MNVDAARAIQTAWIIFLVYWLISSLWAKRIAKREGGAGVARRVITIAAVYLFLFRPDEPWLGVLRGRFVPEVRWVVWLGVAMTFAGIAFAIWARIHIGRYWSATVALKDEHKLIRSGPYARIRHPIYTGFLLAVAGSMLADGRYAGLVLLAILFVMFWLKARKEEALLAGEFGAAFEEHRRHTGFFLPRLRRESVSGGGEAGQK